MAKKKASGARKSLSGTTNGLSMTDSNGGETHQTASDTVLTTNQGVPISDNQNSLKSGARVEDFYDSGRLNAGGQRFLAAKVAKSILPWHPDLKH